MALTRFSDRYGMISVKDPTYGATGDGVVDDSTAIQAAIDAAAAEGDTSNGNYLGAKVVFPPGVYNLGSTGLSFATSRWGGNRSIDLIGSGRTNTALIGNKNGWLLDNNNDVSVIKNICDMTVSNLNGTTGSGAIRMAGSGQARIENCLITGTIGLYMVSNVYNGVVENCFFGASGSNRPSNSIGAVISQVTMLGCRLEGLNRGILTQNTGAHIIGCSCESTERPIIIGIDETGANQNCSSFVIESFQVERVGTAITIQNGLKGRIGPLDLTSTIGPGYSIASSSYAGGTVTVNATKAHGFTGDREIKIEGGGAANGFHTATVVDSDTFTFALGSDPGSLAGATWSLYSQFGMRFRNVSWVTVEGVATAAATWEQAGFDLYNNEDTSIDKLTFISCNAAGAGGIIAGLAGGGGSNNVFATWIKPQVNEAAGIHFYNSNYVPVLTFSQLPGQSGVREAAREGQEYNLSDANIGGKVLGDSITAGSSTGHIKVRRNDSAWKWASN